MVAYYNEIDPYAAQWLRNLIEAGQIAPGIVDERSIEDIKPSDLSGFTQVHFFAGIGVWSLALRRAGWQDDRPVWSGSCPCQPFSAAGAGAGFDDERHLWPAMFHLIEQCKPSVVFGEQVASKDANPWIDLVQTDLEAVGYAFGAVAFPAASVGAPHIRDRLYWVADTESERRAGELLRAGAGLSQDGTAKDSISGRLADTDEQQRDGCGASGASGRAQSTDGSCDGERPSPTNGHWRDADWLLCRDRKWRSVEPGTFPLVNGASSRVGRLRAYGNAINAQAAEKFIECFIESTDKRYSQPK